MGHRQEVCQEKELPPKCANCGKAFWSGHVKCDVKIKIQNSLILRTDYGELK